MDITNIDWRSAPPRDAQVTAHRMYADWLIANLNRPTSIRDTLVPPTSGLTPHWGLIMAARLVQLGATVSTTTPSDAALYWATVVYNADFDIERHMKADEEPFDGYTETVERFLASLVQSLIDATRAPSKSADTKAAHSKGFTDGIAAALKAVQGVAQP